MTTLPKNTEAVSVSFPSWLIEQIDGYIERNDYSRSQLVTIAVRQYLWRKLEDPEHWEQEYNKSHGL